MDALADATPPRSRLRLGAPPIPKEHGAWAFLYLPPILAWALEPPRQVGQATLLLTCVTALYFAQAAARALALGHAAEGAAPWLGLFVVAALAAGAPLLAGPAGAALLALGLTSGLVAGAFAWLEVSGRRERLHRGLVVEIGAVAVMGLTSLATSLVERGSLSSASLWAWLGCALWFASSVFFLRVCFLSQRRSEGTRAELARVKGASAVFHLGLLTLLGVAWGSGWAPAPGVALAFAPAVLRGLGVVLHTPRGLPAARVLGVVEIIGCAWFAAINIAAWG